MSNTGVEIPVDYDLNNLLANVKTPNTIHCRNNQLFGFFRRYLLQEAFSIYKWEMPDDWDPDFFQYALFCFGFVAVIQTRDFGVIPQYAALGGYNVFYRPSYAIITNPLIRGSIRANIGKDCTIIKLMPDYGGIMDLVDYYADRMALTSETIDVDLCNAMVSTVFGAENKADAEAYKKMFDQLRSGNPAVVIGKKFFDDQGKPTWTPFQANVKNTFIVTELLQALRSIREEFLTAIGIPNNPNPDKRERMLTDEVNANNVETRTKCELWMDSIQRGIRQTLKMFPDITLSCEFRYDAPAMNKEEGEDE